MSEKTSDDLNVLIAKIINKEGISDANGLKISNVASQFTPEFRIGILNSGETVDLKTPGAIDFLNIKFKDSIKIVGTPYNGHAIDGINAIKNKMKELKLI